MARRYRTKKLDAARGKLLAVLSAGRARKTTKVAKSRPLSLNSNAGKVKSFLEDAGFSNVLEKKERSKVIFLTTLSDEDITPVDTFHLRIAVEDEHGFVASFLTVPTHVSKKRRGAAAEYSSYVSSLVKAMKFHVDPDDGVVQAEMAIPVATLLGSARDELHRLIGMPLHLLGEFLPGFYDVLGGKDPCKAFHDSLDVDVETETSVGEAEDGGGCSLNEGKSDGADDQTGKHRSEESETATSLSRDYDLSGLNLQSKVPLEKIVGAVKKYRGNGCKADPDSPRLNLLLSGPPGTGKTEFVKYLGVKVGAKVISVAASDLLSPLVGKTEQLIAAKFAEAKSKNAILFIDEVDSFLQSREGASHSWEVTQVNELLQQMEKFGGVLVAATNFKERLDKAVLRRFVYKLKLDYLTDEGKEIFFRRYFKTSLSAEERRRLHAIRDLAPGDYRVVRQSLYYTDEHPTNTQRLEALEAESAAKSEGRPGRIGF